MVVTFHLVLLAWIFFRAATLADACFILKRIVTDFLGRIYMGESQVTTALSVILVLVFVTIEWAFTLGSRRNQRNPSRGWPIAVRWAGYATLIILTAILAVSSNGFIYSKF